VTRSLYSTVLVVAWSAWTLTAQRGATTTTTAAISGELRQWHKVTLTINGPQAEESAVASNPFLDYRMTVTFTHESGSPSFRVPGYFAADGNAGETSATAGNRWRAHLSPDKTGRWNWRVGFVAGKGVAIDASVAGQPLSLHDGLTGTIAIASSNKKAPDFRAFGRLRYAGGHYLRFQGTGDYFLKLGADSPETLLAYADFDGTVALKSQVPLHTYAPHLEDWQAGDPTWKSGKGQGLVGAINYLSAKGVNAMSFLTYNAGGDGDNVWPFVARDDKLHYDVSKLDQWQIVFDHAQRRGLYLHFKLQETENDDRRLGNPHQGRGRASGAATPGAADVPVALDGGDLGPERKLYLRELVARFGHALALNWNLGEESTLSTIQQQAMAQYIKDIDPYAHHIVLHTHPEDLAQDAIYTPLLGSRSALTGASLQINADRVHERTLRWVRASAESGKPWVVANDEQGGANVGTPPDPGYAGFTGRDPQGRQLITLHDIRKYTLWGHLMAGGAGVEHYFGYQLPDNDLTLENFRSREKTWDHGRIALSFFRSEKIPFWDMTNADELVGNSAHDNRRYCLAKAGELYLVYLPTGGTTTIDFSGVAGAFSVAWFDPRNGGPLTAGSVASVQGGASRTIGPPPNHPTEDWLAILRRR
jgi:hypothetical protein